MIGTTSNLPPIVRQKLNPLLLLDFIGRSLHVVSNKICPLASKKLKNCKGRAFQFGKLLEEYHKVYERKKIEKADYEAEVQEKIKKRPCISASGGIISLRRIRDSE